MNFFEILKELLAQSGFAALTWRSCVMILIAFVLLYLAIKKQFEPLQALSNVRTDALSDRSADWTEAPSDSTRSFSYALFSDGTPPRFFLSRSRTGTASNGGGFFLPVLSPGRRSGVHTGAPSDLLSHTPPPRLT